MTVGLDPLTRIINVAWGGKYVLLSSLIGADNPDANWDAHPALTVYNQISGQTFLPWPDTFYPVVPGNFDDFVEAIKGKWGVIFDRGGPVPNGYLLLNLQGGLAQDSDFKVKITRSTYIGSGFFDPVDWLEIYYDDTDKMYVMRAQYHFGSINFDETLPWLPKCSWLWTQSGDSNNSAWLPPDIVSLKQAYNIIKTGFPDD